MAKPKAKRRVIRGGNRTFKERSIQFLASFTSPNRFKRYWLNQQGAQRLGKLAAGGLVFTVLVFVYFAKDLPSPGKINARIGAQNTVFYARDGITKIWEIHGDKNRTVIEFNDMSPNIKNATIAIEDKDFYKHGAFSIFGIGRAFTGIIFRDPSKGGGSTITQQYVKNALLTGQHSYSRKIKELILSIEIEQLYKKDDILKLYLNEIPYGNQAYGIESACRTYFPNNLVGKPSTTKCSSTLNLSQSATLAAIPNLPTYYSPYGQHVDALIERQHEVLDKMIEQKSITADQAKTARLDESNPITGQLVQQIDLNKTPNVQTQISDYPQFALYAQEYLENKLGPDQVESGGLKVITTLDPDKQIMAQAAIDGPHGINAVRRAGGSNVAMVSADPKTGQVLAMIGSYNVNDPNYGAFNVALANRQPGSSFKPFVYATLMARNKNGCTGTTNTGTKDCTTWGPGSTFYDVKTDFGGGYSPKNYSGTNYGVQSMRTALDGSLNIPAVKALYMAGVGNSIKTAHDLGITTLNQPASSYGLSLVLGAGEVKLNDMVNGYSSFANGGMHFEATPILKVTDPHNRTIMDHSKPSGKRALDPQVSYLIANILSDDKSRQFIFGANNPLHINGRTVAAKTGTTENFNDAWTMGFSPDLVTGVWAGNNDNKPMKTEAVDIAAPIWHDYMAGGSFKDKNGNTVKGALASYDPKSNWTAPSGIQTLTLDANTGGAITDATRNKRTDIFPSWFKIQNAGSTQTANIDKLSSKLATDCTPPGAIQSVSSGQIKAEIPSIDPLFSNWNGPVAALARGLGFSSGGSIPTDTDNVHSCSDVKPTVSVTATGTSTLHVTATITSGTFAAQSVVVYFDDQQIGTQALGGSGSYSFDYAPTSNGSHTIKATVTDAGLYAASGETTVTVTGAGSGSGGSPTFP
jgi:membrane peptidoglycan carboxypeptidase